MDPFQGLASLILGKLKDSTIALWWKFLFELLFSGAVSFLLICGVTLLTAKSWAVGAGTGMVTAAVVMTVVFRKETSRLTKGMFVVLPALEADKELSTDLQTIQKKE